MAGTEGGARRIPRDKDNDYTREAARAAYINMLNKPVKPASLRAIIGQWCKQRLVAAE